MMTAITDLARGVPPIIAQLPPLEHCEQKFVTIGIRTYAVPCARDMPSLSLHVYASLRHFQGDDLTLPPGWIEVETHRRVVAHVIAITP